MNARSFDHPIREGDVTLYGFQYFFFLIVILQDISIASGSRDIRVLVLPIKRIIDENANIKTSLSSDLEDILHKH